MLAKLWRHRLAIILPSALALAYVTATVSIVGVTRYDNPELAIRLIPNDAVANAMAADRISQGELTAGTQAQIVALSTRALQRSVLSPIAMRLLGFVAEQQGHPELARARIRAAGTLTHRDLATRLWLIDDAVARVDLNEALHEFDVAMRISTTARRILFPILSEALVKPDIIVPMIRLLNTSPNWARDFLVASMQAGRATENTAIIVGALRPVGSPRDRQIAETLLGRLIAEGRYSTVRRFLGSPIALAAGSGGQANATRVGPFDETGGVFPFAWDFSREASLRAEVSISGLGLYAEVGHGGVVASRLLMLKPGRYQFETRGGGSSQGDAGQIVWTLKCPDLPESLLGEATFLTDGISRIVRSFVVTPSCPAQSLQLAIHPTGNETAVTGQIDMVRITPQSIMVR